MIICIPIETKPQGGAYYFIDLFRHHLASRGIGHTQDIGARYDVLFLNAWHVTYYQIIAAWRANPEVRLVHRVDGAAQDYGRQDDADNLQHRVSQLADATIFQSQYCRHSTREKYPVITQDGPVIWNAVDTALFTPEGPRRALAGRVRICYVTYSTNPRKGAPELYRVAAAHPDVDFYLCGRYENPPLLPNLHVLGLLGRQELAEVMRSCDVFLTFSQNEACPNVVLEAMASGKPVLYLDSGAAPELVQEAGVPVTVESFHDQLQLVLADLGGFSHRARQRAIQHFHPHVIFPRYLAVFEHALASALRVPPARRRVMSQMAWLAEPIERGWNNTRPLRRRIVGKLRTLWS